MKLKIKNATKYRQKAVKISFMCGCKYVSVYNVGVCVCMWIRVFKLSQARNIKRWLQQKWVTNIYTFVAIYSFVDSGTNYHHCKLWEMSENLICKGVWSIYGVCVYIYIYIYIYMYIIELEENLHCWPGLEYADYISCRRIPPQEAGVLMVRFQFWSSEECVQLPFITITPRSTQTWIGSVSVMVSSVAQIDIFKNCSYSVGLCTKKLLSNNYTKDVNMNVIP